MICPSCSSNRTKFIEKHKIWLCFNCDDNFEGAHSLKIDSRGPIFLNISGTSQYESMLEDYIKSKGLWSEFREWVDINYPADLSLCGVENE